MRRFIMAQIVTIAVLTILCSHRLLAQDHSPTSEPTKLVTLRESWKEARARDIIPLRKNYRLALDRLLKELTRKEQFDDALLVRDELDSLDKEMPREAGQPGGPSELKTLRNTFGRELRKVNSRLNHKYRDALEQLQRSYSQAGELDAALATRHELAKVTHRLRTAALGTRIAIPDDAASWKDHHYKFFSSPRISFSKAKAACEALGGHLAILETEEERVFLHALHNGGGAWVGGSDQEDEGKFTWLDGTPFSTSVKNYLGNDNNAGRDFLHLQKSGAVSTRANRGHEPSFPLKWVNGYLCEWDQ